MATLHAYLPPSGADAWTKCSMWPTMNARFPQPDTPDTLLGTAAHWLLTRLVEDPRATFTEDDTGHPLTRDMHLDVLPTAELIREIIAQRPDDMVSEQYIPCPSVSEFNGGSPDFAAAFIALRKIVVVDFKYGHDPVAAVDNGQGLNYGLAMLDRLESRIGSDVDYFTIHIYIDQPRDFSVHGAARKYWATESGQVRAIRNKFKGAADKALMERPEAVPGVPQCKHCPGAAVCPSSQSFVTQLVQRATAPGDITALEASKAGRELRYLRGVAETVKNRIETLEVEIAAGLSRGERGYGFVRESPGAAARKWTAPPAEVARLAIMHGVDVRRPVDVITPAQAIKAGLPDEVVKTVSRRTDKAPVLTPVEQTRAYRAFKSNPVKKEQ